MAPLGNVLSAGSLSAIMASMLPESASPQLNTPYDAIALASHSCMVAVGFRLVSLNDEGRLEDSSSPSSSSPDSRLPEQWNATAPNYTFRYAHSQSSMEHLLKINRMGNKAIVMGMGLGDDKTASFDVKVADYISESSLPATPVDSQVASDRQSKAIVDIFISNGRLSDFGSLMRISIVQKLTPALNKEGYQESAAESTAARRAEPQQPRRDPLREDYQPPARPHPLHNPLAQPRSPFPQGELAPPGFEDPYDLNRPLRPIGGTHPGFGNIGERDLYPQGLGPRDPFGGAAPGFGGGMHPTLEDIHGGAGRGIGYDPSAPPGSRYDPVGPGGAPRGSGGSGFPGSGMGGRPPNPFGGFGSGDFI